MGGQGDRNIISFSEKQNQAMDAIASERYNFILFGGALGGGKTIWGLSALLIMCEIFPKSRWCVIREDLEKIRTTTIPSFKKLNPSGKLRESPYEYTHPNGSQILFKGENYDNDKELLWLRGFEASGFLFEEINECREITLDIAFSRAGRWESDPRPKPIILATCNPANNWVKERIYDKFKLGQLPKNWLYIQSKVTDNPYLTPEYLENLKNMPRYQYEVFVEGNWDISLKQGGEFYKCFELDKHVVECEYDPKLPLHISFDENVNPYLPVGIFQLEGNEIRWIDSIEGKNPDNTIKAVCNAFKRRYPNHESGVFVYGDATSQKDDVKLEKGHNFFRLILNELSDYKPQLRVTPANPSVAMRGMFINAVLEINYEGIVVKIDPRNKTAINDFVNVKEAPDGTKHKAKETDPKTGVSFQKWGHFTDLFDYLITYAHSSAYTKYQKGNRSMNIRMGGVKNSNRY